jgi:hypothetical protein
MNQLEDFASEPIACNVAIPSAEGGDVATLLRQKE